MALLLVFFSAAILFLGMPTGHCADIVGGEESVPHSRPYMAALFFRGKFDCGGTLISRNWVLTAAHCHVGKGDTVILGAHSPSDIYENGKQRFRVIRRIRHRNFNNDTLANDIMLLKLNRRATINQYVQTIQLPTSYEDVQTGTQCLVAGWGYTEHGVTGSDKLREAYISIQDRGICRKTWRSHVTANHLCAAVTNQRKGICGGDSGGPLICGGTQRGITSFGLMDRCAVPGIPEVYTRLTREYLLWINNIIWW